MHTKTSQPPDHLPQIALTHQNSTSQLLSKQNSKSRVSPVTQFTALPEIKPTRERSLQDRFMRYHFTNLNSPQSRFSRSPRLSKKGTFIFGQDANETVDGDRKQAKHNDTMRSFNNLYGRPLQSLCHETQRLGKFESMKFNPKLPQIENTFKLENEEVPRYPTLGLSQSPKATTATILEWRKNMKSFILGFNRTSSQRVLKDRLDNQEYDDRNAVFDQVFLKKSEHVETDHINLTLHSLDIEYSAGEITKGDNGQPHFNFPSFDTRHLKLTFKNLVGLFWMNKPMLEQCLQSALELDPGSIDPELVLNEEKLQRACLSATKMDRGHRLETYAKFAMVLNFGKSTVIHALVTLPRVEINNPNRAYTFMHYLHVQEMHQLMSAQFQNWAPQVYDFVREKKIFKQYAKRIFKEHKVKQLSTDPLGVRITQVQLPENPFIYSRQFSGGFIIGSSMKYV